MVGQKGNKNALKHGFYSRAFREIELNDLESLEEGLMSEIAMLRVATRRLFDIYNAYHESAHDPDSGLDSSVLADLSDTLNTLGLANIRVASLIKTNTILTGGKGNLMELLLDEITYAQRQKGLIP